jgi:hypothetical protein
MGFHIAVNVDDEDVLFAQSFRSFFIFTPIFLVVAVILLNFFNFNVYYEIFTVLIARHHFVE